MSTNSYLHHQCSSTLDNRKVFNKFLPCSPFKFRPANSFLLHWTDWVDNRLEDIFLFYFNCLVAHFYEMSKSLWNTESSSAKRKSLNVAPRVSKLRNWSLESRVLVLRQVRLKSAIIANVIKPLPHNLLD